MGERRTIAVGSQRPVATVGRALTVPRAVFFLAPLVMFASFARSQDTVWAKRYDIGRPGWDEWSSCGTADRFGDVIHLAGLTALTEPESTAVLVVKCDSAGETLWTRVFDSGAAEDWPGDIKTDTEGNVVVAGYYSYAESSYCGGQLVKFDRQGRLRWSRRFRFEGGLRLDGVAVDGYQNIFATGYCWDDSSHQALMMKCTSEGSLSWTRAYSLGGVVELFAGLALDRQGFMVAAGNVYLGSWLPLLVKFTPEGDTMWTRRPDLRMDESCILTGVTTDGSGNIVVSGWGRQSSAEPMRALTAKFTPEGDSVWVRTYEAPRHAFGFGVAVDSLGGILTVGSVDDPPMGVTWSCLLVKRSPQGDTEWTRTYRQDAFDIATAASFVGHSDVYVFGATSDSMDENPDLVLMRVRHEAGITEPELVGVSRNPAEVSGPTLMRHGELLRLAVKKAGDYRVLLCDAAGRTIRVLHSGRLEPGEHRFSLAAVPAGVYFCRIESGPTRLSRKVVLPAGN